MCFIGRECSWILKLWDPVYVFILLRCNHKTLSSPLCAFSSWLNLSFLPGWKSKSNDTSTVFNSEIWNLYAFGKPKGAEKKHKNLKCRELNWKKYLLMLMNARFWDTKMEIRAALFWSNVSGLQTFCIA